MCCQKGVCTWFALDSVGSCPLPKEMREGGGTSKDKVNKVVANLEVKNRVKNNV